ncbi:hypothetical protein [Umezawaea sp. Da 62-37]|uniref:hypothetical protein n=1 Tax=Umezawaea sp. Da 62-37 TaxID=3075927 RepID=UPI0028F6F34F|nr:hypothetical protein [Umezawaea sp. Da 62-37]WNV87490.1 hypothetical protein RM788_04075 [Umezawaea sp. Da 62-37]
MSPRKPASTTVLVLWVAGSMVVSLAVGILWGKAFPTTTRPIYIISAVLLVVMMGGFRLLGGFDRLDQARKNRGSPR